MPVYKAKDFFEDTFQLNTDVSAGNVADLISKTSSWSDWSSAFINSLKDGLFMVSILFMTSLPITTVMVPVYKITESLNLLDLREEFSQNFYESLMNAQRYIKEEFYEKYCEKQKQTICCVGHTHIDVVKLVLYRKLIC
jgi:hypothetical protein